MERVDGGIFHDPIYPTPPLRQDMTQGQFFKRSLRGLNFMMECGVFSDGGSVSIVGGRGGDKLCVLVEMRK